MLVTNEMEITLKVIGGKWKPLILHYLKDNGPTRYNEIVKYLGNAPKKTITLQLRELENDNIIIREVLSLKPLSVQYQISDHGKTLYPILEAMCDWGYENKAQYDLSHPLCK